MDPLVPAWKRAILKAKHRLQTSPGSSSLNRLKRRKAMVSFITRHLTFFISTLFLVGYGWMLLIPSPQLAQRTYIDENALQPNQVNTFWDWKDVHAADTYLGKLEHLRDNNATSQERAQFIVSEFRKLGISSAAQNYAFDTSIGVRNGTNAYSILESPRISGNEAIVISASWLSRIDEGDGIHNLRGVAMVLALAGFLKRYSYWAKDIILVINDGYLEGMHAWLAAYHGSPQSNLNMESLELSSGVIWTALNIDYPGHSLSHLGIFFEGLNGRLPNQDLINSLHRISHKEGIPVILYDSLDSQLSNPNFIPSRLWSNPSIQGYLFQARNVIRQFGYQLRGRPSGVHGLFHQFRIDAITMFGVPATGPHGFHSIGRVIESTLRTTNNLLERLHASFFFYVMTQPDRFLKIGKYLPSAVLISVAMMFTGLRAWSDAAWIIDTASKKPTVTWKRRQRPILSTLGIMAITHILGALLLTLVTNSYFIEHRKVASSIAFACFAGIPMFAFFVHPYNPTQNTSPLSSVLKSLNLCYASTVISITTVLNFPMAVLLAILLGIPLAISSAQGHLALRLAKSTTYTFLGLGWLIFGQEEMLKAVQDWQILSAWFTPFTCLIYVPLMLQAGLICLLPSS